MDRAFQHDELVLVEAFGGSREIEVGVLDGSPPQVSVPGEVVPAGDFYDYESKYLSPTDTDARIPAELPAGRRGQHPTTWRSRPSESLAARGSRASTSSTNPPATG